MRIISSCSLAAMLLGLALPCAAAPVLGSINLGGENLTDHASIMAGGLTVSLAMQGNPKADDALDYAPVLTIEQHDKTVFTIPGTPAGFDFPQGSATIAEMDPDNATPEIAFDSFSGGAHCCTDVIIVHQTESGWQTLDLGWWDGGGGTIEDADGDGIAEFVARDNAFLYTFDAYAFSFPPPIILSVVGGKAADVSAEPRFRPVFVKALGDMEAFAAEQDESSSLGFLAGWVATRIRLGEGEAAWQAMLQRYDAASDPGTPLCYIDTSVECDSPEDKTLSFPDALYMFLNDNGYPITRPD